MKTQYINLSVNKNNFVRYKNIKSICLYGNEKELGNFFISICIPTFKRTNLLKEALDSALNQKTHVPYCILVLDNENTGIENENYKLSHSIEFCGFAESDWKEHKFENSYERIALILVDYKYLLDCYYKKEKLVIKNLIDNIEKINSYK